MGQAVKTAATLVVLLVVLGIAGAWGWSALTEPLPGLADAPTCVETPVTKGTTVTVEQVTVSVLNAGKRSGLANRTMDELQAQGFNEGDSANAPADTDVGYAQIWTDDPESPAVALLQAHLKRSKTVPTDLTALAMSGVVLVVGDRFDEVQGGLASVESAIDTTICSPPL